MVRLFASDWSEITPLPAPSGAQLAVRSLAASADGAAIRGVIQFCHGAAEHAGRYGELASVLSAAGFHVIAHDHRGHGETTTPGVTDHVLASDGRLSGPENKTGWDLLIEDVEHIHTALDDAFPDLPRLVMGHSMGSVAALEFALRRPERAGGLCLLGPVLAKNPAMPLLRALLNVEALFKSPDAVSILFEKLGWDPLNKEFQPARTPYDWLSRDDAEVDAYIADPMCGWRPTMNFAKELSRGLAATYDDARLNNLRADMPVLLMSGAEDPSTEFAKSVPELKSRLSSAGLRDIETEIFPDMRHELHNEVGRDAVFGRLTAWCRRASATLATR